MSFGYCDCLDCKYCPDRGLLDSECPMTWKLPEDWDVPIDVFMRIVTYIGCDLFVPRGNK
jgi:hypothetical protein